MKAYGNAEIYLFSLISALYTGGESASSLARFNPEDKGLFLTLGIGGSVGSVVPRGVFEGFKPRHPAKFRRPSKIVPKSTRL